MIDNNYTFSAFVCSLLCSACSLLIRIDSSFGIFLLFDFNMEYRLRTNFGDGITSMSCILFNSSIALSQLSSRSENIGEIIYKAGYNFS